MVRWKDSLKYDAFVLQVVVKTHFLLPTYPFDSSLHDFLGCCILVFTISQELKLESFTLRAQFSVILVTGPTTLSNLKGAGKSFSYRGMLGA